MNKRDCLSDQKDYRSSNRLINHTLAKINLTSSHFISISLFTQTHRSILMHPLQIFGMPLLYHNHNLDK